MRVVSMVAAEGEVALWPLSGGVGEQFVGGGEFRAWQEELAGGAAVSLVENAWVSAADWSLLLGTDGPAVLESHEGDVLAWTGRGDRPADAVVAMGSEESFLVRYAWDLLRVNEYVVPRQEAGPNERVIEFDEGTLIVGEGTKVLPGVYVEGKVLIGKNCKIGPNCYLRGSISIGDGCHVGQSVEVKNSIIGHGSSTGHLSYLGDTILGSKVNLGAGTITSNLRHDGKNHRSMVAGELVDTGRRKFGMIAGDFVHTGIHTAIYPGRKIGPGVTTRPNESVERDLM
tara:strand:- start:197 stop:1051 length:855 start_codon:yes stop_codon:yes gene_type:complete